MTYNGSKYKVRPMSPTDHMRARWLIFLPQAYRPPPYLGEHTDEVLAEFGYTEAQIAEFHKAGAV